MNLNKSRDVFDPSTVKDPVHIIGCGSVGSTVAELLARYGITKFVLWDMDLVESKNIVNQMFTERDVGRLKTEALLDILSEINPAIKDTARIESNGWSGQPLTGYIFLAVDKGTTSYDDDMKKQKEEEKAAESVHKERIKKFSQAKQDEEDEQHRDEYVAVIAAKFPSASTEVKAQAKEMLANSGSAKFSSPDLPIADLKAIAQLFE